MRGSKSMVVCSRGALSPCLEAPRQSEAATAVQLSFFDRAHGFRAAIALGEFFHAAGRVHEFLFAGEKRMTSGADTDSNVTTRRARFIDRTARADDICFVIFWVNACFHRQK